MAAFDIALSVPAEFPPSVRHLALALLYEVERVLESDPTPADDRLARLGLMLGEPEAGGLAGWQKRRLEALMTEQVAAPLCVADLAAAVRLSPSHFARAFKRSFGETPHMALMRRRVECAKSAMLSGDEPLSQIALACGFADQAHLSRSFRAFTGQSPLRWRRAHAPGD